LIARLNGETTSVNAQLVNSRWSSYITNRSLSHLVHAPCPVCCRPDERHCLPHNLHDPTLSLHRAALPSCM